MNPRATLALTLLGGAAYALLSHRLMTHAAHSAWSLAALLGPIVAGLLLGLWRSGQRALTLLLAAAALALCAASVRGPHLPAEWLYVAQHAGVHAGLGLWFGSTLRKGATPLISQIARRVHRGLVPEMARYTRQVTAAWTLYFAAMALTSLALFAWAPFTAWSLFANVLTPLSMVAVFIAEYVVRYRLHPGFERATLMDAIHAYSRRDESAAAQATDTVPADPASPHHA
jgi:uncharacterized membrane protein